MGFLKRQSTILGSTEIWGPTGSMGRMWGRPTSVGFPNLGVLKGTVKHFEVLKGTAQHFGALKVGVLKETEHHFGASQLRGPTASMGRMWGSSWSPNLHSLKQQRTISGPRPPRKPRAAILKETEHRFGAPSTSTLRRVYRGACGAAPHLWGAHRRAGRGRGGGRRRAAPAGRVPPPAGGARGGGPGSRSRPSQRTPNPGWGAEAVGHKCGARMWGTGKKVGGARNRRIPIGLRHGGPRPKGSHS